VVPADALSVMRVGRSLDPPTLYVEPQAASACAPLSSTLALTAAGAGAQTVMKVFTVLGSVLSEAVRQGHIHASPTRAISRPKQRRRRAVRPPTPDRVEIIRAGLESGVERALVTLLAYVGLRPQEALAAVWSDMTSGKLVVDAAKTGRTRVARCAGRAPGTCRAAAASGATGAGGADHRD
jgi:site-specific recombinase XerC